jgi:serine phosphatase RsbU (regulator of sigma subunit)
VGVGSAVPRSATSFRVTAGSKLVAYTDGLVERRGRRLSEGLESLRRGAEDVGRHVDADTLVDNLLAKLIPEGSDDDIAILGVRWLM